MVICPSCRSEQMNGTLFCSECGADLQTPATPTFDLPSEPASPHSFQTGPTVPRPVRAPGTPVRSSMPPARPVSTPVQAHPDTSKGAAPPRRNQIPVRSDLRLIVLNSGRVLECPDQENVIIGRSDATTGDVPDIDMTPDNALELGVSRRHACITFRDNQVFLTDLGSTNRTFLNRQVMMRGQPYEIQDGDEVRLGNVIVKVILNSDGLMR
jgi:hypothetical protein